MIPMDLEGRKLLAAERFETLRRPTHSVAGRGVLRRWLGKRLLALGARLAGEERQQCRPPLSALRAG